MYIVGITGGIGSGKTTVANLFAQHNIPIVDMDHIAHEIVAPNTKLEATLLDYFGTQITDNQNHLDRKKLAHIIFADPSKKEWLEALLHPIIWDEALKRVKAKQAPYAILVIPLLIESHAMDKVDKVLVVDSDPETQIARARARDGLSREQVLAIMDNQVSREERLKFADDVINNSNDLQTLKQQVDLLHQNYLTCKGPIF